MCTTTYESAVSWYPNDGSGGFGERKVISKALRGVCLADAADVDQDGDIDVFVAASDSNSISWFEGNGPGAFFPVQTLSASALGARDLSLADLDGDGDSDVAAASELDDTFRIFTNRLHEQPPLMKKITALHATEAGFVSIVGKSLAGVEVRVDGELVPVTASSETQATFRLAPDQPGGLHDVQLVNSFGSNSYPGGARARSGPRAAPHGGARRGRRLRASQRRPRHLPAGGLGSALLRSGTLSGAWLVLGPGAERRLVRRRGDLLPAGLDQPGDARHRGLHGDALDHDRVSAGSAGTSDQLGGLSTAHALPPIPGGSAAGGGDSARNVHPAAGWQGVAAGPRLPRSRACW